MCVRRGRWVGEREWNSRDEDRETLKPREGKRETDRLEVEGIEREREESEADENRERERKKIQAGRQAGTIDCIELAGG